MRHYVYRYFDREGRLLYVGCSKNPWQRYVNHQNDSRIWIHEVVRGRISVFPSKVEALAAEKAAIIAEKPAYNVRYRWSHRNGWTEQEYIDYAQGYLRAAPDPIYAWDARHMHAVREVYAALFGHKLPADPRLILRQRRAA